MRRREAFSDDYKLHMPTWHFSDTPMMSKSSGIILVTGGHGFIGSHVAHRLHSEGKLVRVADVSPNCPFDEPICSETTVGDLCDYLFCEKILDGVNTVLHFAAVMGGMGTIHSQNDWIIYTQNHLMTTNLVSASLASGVASFFLASSACVYPKSLQSSPDTDIQLAENDVLHLPASPQDLYGLEKLNAENLLSQFKDKLNVRIARFHNVYGPRGAWRNGREKAPAALLRKALATQASITAGETADFEIWGDGTQRRSFLWIEDCVEAVLALLDSKCDSPVNIGSEESVTISQLASTALLCAEVPLDVVRFVYDHSKPVGVGSRNSNNSFMQQITGWKPTTTLESGLHQTTDWMKNEMDHLLSDLDAHTGKRLIQDLRQSAVVRLRDSTITFGILLPITSRGLASPEDCLTKLRNFAASVSETTWRDIRAVSGTRYNLRFYVIIDEDDTFLGAGTDAPSKPEAVLREFNFTHVRTSLAALKRGDICGLWRMAAREAYEDHCDYCVLMGDDVTLKDEGWMRTIHTEFRKLLDERGCPIGFGCVAFTDVTFPGMPTFPVVHRLHLEIFGGDIVPTNFINQDGDPFLFQLYRRWGCSRMVSSRIANDVGGSFEARYDKIHTSNWTHDILSTATRQVARYLTEAGPSVVYHLTVDVVIPCYRVDISILDAILALEPSPTCSVMFIIIIDDPTSSHIPTLLHRFSHRVDVRIRVNQTNRGASFSRNRGLKESAAEYVHFLDDDIVPSPDLLIEAEKAILAAPSAAGFIGCCNFPPAHSIFTTAVHLAGVTYFWDIAAKVDKHFPGLKHDLPWGVTANLIVKRYIQDEIAFSEIFPKTGGGEDIDYCILKRNFSVERKGEGLHAAEKVRIVHPWWRDGSRSYWRFYMWAKGDGALIALYPSHSYRDSSPNFVESIVLIAMATVLSVVVRVQSLRSAARSSTTTILAFFMAQVLHDLYRHLYRDSQRTLDVDSSVCGYRWVIAVLESTLIRLASDGGRLKGHQERREVFNIGKRFDWFLGRVGNGPKNEERMNGMQRMVLSVALSAVLLPVSACMYST